MVEVDPQGQPWVPVGTSTYAWPKAGPRPGTGIHRASHATWQSRELVQVGELGVRIQRRTILSLAQDSMRQSVAQTAL